MPTPYSPHSFHIPVMGTGYTIDTPLKVAHFGISSVVSIIDHRLAETMREYHSRRLDLPFEAISDSDPDNRAKKITAFLNFMHDEVNRNFERLKTSSFSAGSEITKYFEMLPDASNLKVAYDSMLLSAGEEKLRLQTWLRDHISPGAIDVNIMTKIDGTNYTEDKVAQESAFNDAHAALRGFALSELDSSVVLSAGLNPRLFGYMASFRDFFADATGTFKKKITLKVSDFRSALIQGKYLAKKGLWVSEFRVESGLNCGGHAFASDGHLMGPILHEFKERRDELKASLFELYSTAMLQLGWTVPSTLLEQRFSAQGGVGSMEEHQLLLEEYQLNSIGWGSPFLLVPEAVNIDAETVKTLCEATEDQYYLSDASPLGVRFNTLRTTTAHEEIEARIAAGKPGSPCYKKHLVSNTEFTKSLVCTASRRYQSRKIKEINESMPESSERNKAIGKVTEKMCLCVGLGNAALIRSNVTLHKGVNGVAICPGPNLAYFSKEASLREMIDHIYGRSQLIDQAKRPHMFVKEFSMYVDYYEEKVASCKEYCTEKQEAYLDAFQSNLNACVDYYDALAGELPAWLGNAEGKLMAEIFPLQARLNLARV
ncbi:MAG: hypothetical protein HQ500_00765 [Flavobacteriales bacterium]|nr:hypothetical protein [Flavobacteriales bacterium]